MGDNCSYSLSWTSEIPFQARLYSEHGPCSHMFTVHAAKFYCVHYFNSMHAGGYVKFLNAFFLNTWILAIGPFSHAS